MTLLSKVMAFVFIAAWCIGVAGWLYGTRYWLPMWAAGFNKVDRHKGYWRKAKTGYGVFILSLAVGFAAGGVAQCWGGGWR